MWTSGTLAFTFLVVQAWRLAVSNDSPRRAIVAAYVWGMATYAWLCPGTAFARGFLFVAALPFLGVYWHMLKLRQYTHHWRV